MLNKIDFDKLGEIEDGNHGWRAALQSGLSDVYVSGEGDNVEAFIVGEAPGAQEQAQKRPFVGPAGILLRRLMALANLYSAFDQIEVPRGKVANCWLTNTVHFRPPRNRTPTPMEVLAAKPWLLQEWEAVGAPLAIVPVGGVATRAILGKNISILRVAGECIVTRSKVRKVNCYVFPMVHPSFALRPENAPIRPILEQHWNKLGKWREENQ